MSFMDLVIFDFQPPAILQDQLLFIGVEALGWDIMVYFKYIQYL